MSNRPAGHGEYGTAQLVAGQRAKCTADPVLRRLCYDPWAYAFCEGQASDRLAANLAQSGGLPDFHLWIGARTAFFDAVITDAVLRCGVDQVVIHGAGFDTRCNRLGLSPHRATFFEIDMPNIQTHKMRIVEGSLTKYKKELAEYIQCDFETQNFMDLLGQHPKYRKDKAGLFLVEGVFYYLTEEAVRSTLRSISSHAHPHSFVAFDYFSKVSVFGTKTHRQSRAQEVLRSAREPMLFGLDHPVGLLTSEGFRYVVHHSFDEILLHCTGSHDLRRFFRFQGLCVACIQRPPIVPSYLSLLPFSKL